MTVNEMVTIAAVVIMGLNLAWTILWSTRMKRAIDDASNKAEVDGHGERIIKLETRFEAIPNFDDLDKLHKRIGDLQKKVAELCAKEMSTREAVNGLKRSVDLLIEKEMVGE